MIFEAHQNLYFVRLYCINILTKHILTTKLKNRSSFFIFFLKGGKVRKENGGKKM